MQELQPESPGVDQVRSRKKRKVRKGTKSCWECKRRKIRCEFSSQSDDVCVGCQRRGTSCLTQEYDDANNDPQTLDKHKDMEEKLRRAEGLIDRMMEAAAHLTPSTAPPSHTPTTPATSAASRGSQAVNHWISPSAPASTTSFPSIQVFDSTLSDEGCFMADNVESTPLPSVGAESGRLCQQLYAVLPPQHDADVILRAGCTASFLQFFTLPYKEIFAGNLRPASSMSAIPNPPSHPILLARTLLYLAHGLQHLHSSDACQLSLDDPPGVIMKRYFDAASLVTGDDQFLSSLEGLECLLLETVFHINGGSLRRAWLAIKRAIGLAQLMGLHRRNPRPIAVLDAARDASPSVLWHRIVSQERYLALMLGLPTSAVSLALPSAPTGPSECPSNYLERNHSEIMDRIAARNDSDDCFDDTTITHSIDQQLQKAAQGMPTGWWLLPRPRHRGNSAGDTFESLEDVLRILLQITHFGLLILLHLPYMLRSVGNCTYDYSKQACVNASRELLNRYIRARCLHQTAFCCTGIDFSAFTACLSLLVAHVQRAHHGQGTVDFLAHQRLSDRALVEEVVGLMMEVNSAGTDALLEQTASILKSLLDIEADAADNAHKDCCAHANGEGNGSNRVLRLKIPYYGNLCISRNGVFSNVDVTPPSESIASAVMHHHEPTSFIPSASYMGLGQGPDILFPSFELNGEQTYQPNALSNPIFTGNTEPWTLDGTFRG
ncbi:Dehydrocurvularin biosynthesis regulator [Colletotrichum spinosum]|uniref:Dehydrocurvularin biosynthesis regulator n=1 Tax=Colletotrichum spinosum TaxID=1347390 RepID=A0A4R8PVP4_9PEZI|nr:Dehydrocurvularin biosynthesis regulator [Colletotrichum spinosum]